jgi:hypothetical protein
MNVVGRPEYIVAVAGRIVRVAESTTGEGFAETPPPHEASISAAAEAATARAIQERGEESMAVTGEESWSGGPESGPARIFRDSTHKARG